MYGSSPDIAGSGRPSRPPARTPVSIPYFGGCGVDSGRALLMHGSFGCPDCCDPQFLRRPLRPHYRAPAAAKRSPSRSCRRRRGSVHGAYLVITTPGPYGSDVPGRSGPPAGDHRQCLPGSRSSALPLPHHWLATCRAPPPSRVRGHPPLPRGCTTCFAVTCPRLPASHGACRRARQCHPYGGSVGWRGLPPALHPQAPARCVACPTRGRPLTSPCSTAHKHRNTFGVSLVSFSTRSYRPAPKQETYRHGHGRS